MHTSLRQFLLFGVALLGLHSTGMSIASVHAQSSPALDMAALTLRPDDVGQPGWLHDGAFVEGLDGESRNQAAYLGRGTTASSVAEKLTAMGWRRMYVGELILPSGANANAPTQRIRSYVTEYASADGAAAGFAYLEDESAVVSAKDLVETRTFGEESEITSDSGVSSLDARSYRSLDLTFRVGALVAGVTLIVYPSKTATTPDRTVVGALGAVMEARVASPPTDGAGLGRAVARLMLPGDAVTSYDDAYYRLSGTDIPVSGETARATANRVLTYKDATDVYQLWQGVGVGTSSGFLYGVTLLHFATPTAASDWVTNLRTILGENPFYARLQPVTNVGTVGDQSHALSYAAGGGAETPRSILIAVRVGNDVARVHLVPQGRIKDVSPASILALAQGEASCLQGNSCAGVVALPEDLSAPTPGASPVASPAA